MDIQDQTINSNDDLSKKKQDKDPTSSNSEESGQKPDSSESIKFENTAQSSSIFYQAAGDITIGGPSRKDIETLIKDTTEKTVKSFLTISGEEEKLNTKFLSGDIHSSNVILGNNNIINVVESSGSQELAEYGKYYIIGLCFYHGLRVSDFLSVLDATKKYLSKKLATGNKINFPSYHPDVKTREEFDPERLAVTIKFLKEAPVDVLTQAKKEYVSVLFNYISILNEIVETQPNNWELRWRSAVGLGQISELDVLHVFNTVINNWVKDERAFVRATVGYYYYYILSGDSNLPNGAQKFLLERFERWADPKDFTESHWRYKWTVAAVCEKIGLLKNEQAEMMANKYLEQVAGINHIRVADSVIHAFIEWSIKQKFPQVFKLLVSWAESGSAGDQDEDNPFEIRCIVALIAFSAIVEVNYDLLNDNKGNKQENIFPVDVLHTIWENQSGNDNFWRGMISVGIRYFDFRMGHYFFDMLESWTESISEKEFLIEFISSWLKEIYFNMKSKTHLENRLKNIWAKSKNKTLKSIAQITQEKIKTGI